MPLSPAFLSFRAQLAAGFGLVLVLLALTLAVTLGTMMTSQQREAQGRVLQTSAHHTARLLGDGLAERIREVTVLASSSDLWAGGLDSPAVQAMLERSQATRPDNAWIGVSDAAGIIRAGTGNLMIGRSAVGRPWFAPASNAAHIGDVHPAVNLAAFLPPSTDGEMLRFVDFAAPINVNGRHLGVLVAHGSWAWADRVVRELSSANAEDEMIETFIFDRAGRMIYAPGATLASFLQAGQGMPAASDEATVSQWKDGKEYLAGAAAATLPADAVMQGLGWQVVTRQPTAIAFAEARRGVWRIVKASVGATVLAMGLVWLVSRRMSRALGQIAEAARNVTLSVPGSDLPVLRTNREVEELTLALSDMTDSLRSANQDLEQRVRSRTAELQSANAQFEELANTDPLTGLLNRRGFAARLQALVEEARRHGKPVSLIMIDADHFKRINDTYGHEVGDATLVHIATALRRRLRDGDAIARIGGEEFVALLANTDAATARRVAQDLIEVIGAQQLPTVGSITISCGVSQVSLASDDGTRALRRADAAMYNAKENGRNRAEFLASALATLE